MDRTDTAIDDAMAELIGQLKDPELSAAEITAIKEKIEFLKSLTAGE